MHLKTKCHAQLLKWLQNAEMKVWQLVATWDNENQNVFWTVLKLKRTALQIHPQELLSCLAGMFYLSNIHWKPISDLCFPGCLFNILPCT